jgi:hypothetical protein
VYIYGIRPEVPTVLVIAVIIVKGYKQLTKEEENEQLGREEYEQPEDEAQRQLEQAESKDRLERFLQSRDTFETFETDAEYLENIADTAISD